MDVTQVIRSEQPTLSIRCVHDGSTCWVGQRSGVHADRAAFGAEVRRRAHRAASRDIRLEWQRRADQRGLAIPTSYLLPKLWPTERWRWVAEWHDALPKRDKGMCKHGREPLSNSSGLTIHTLDKRNAC